MPCTSTISKVVPKRRNVVKACEAASGQRKLISKELSLVAEPNPKSVKIRESNSLVNQGQKLHIATKEHFIVQEAIVPAPTMRPALIRVFEDRVVCVTLLKPETSSPSVTSLRSSKCTMSTARLLALTVLIASSSALSLDPSRGLARICSQTTKASQALKCGGPLPRQALNFWDCFEISI